MSTRRAELECERVPCGKTLWRREHKTLDAVRKEVDSLVSGSVWVRVHARHFCTPVIFAGGYHVRFHAYAVGECDPTPADVRPLLAG